MKQAWSRIAEVRARDGRPAGLEYQYACGHTHLFSHQDILTYLAASEEDSYALDAPKTCPEGCEVVEPASEEASK